MAAPGRRAPGAQLHRARPQPAALHATLRPYQADGFGWLAFLWEHQLGGILADDMGLGKTVQSLALICHARQAQPGLAPFFIVAPTSVTANWVTEAARFAPDLTVAGISGTLRKRGQDLGDSIAGADVVVTSYTLLRLDFDAYAAADGPACCSTRRSSSRTTSRGDPERARDLPAPFKLAITGTPMENNLMELWSLLSVTAPELFPRCLEIRAFFTPVRLRTAAIRSCSRSCAAGFRPLVLRRTKERVAADLPAKQEQVSRWTCIRGTGRSISGICSGSGRKSSA